MLLLRRCLCCLATGWLLMLLVPAVAAQGLDAVLRGQVLDAETHQPIPNAQLGIAHNRLGTSTNIDGRFALRVPVAYQGGELEVALLGYQRYRQALPLLPGPPLTIYLKINPAALGTVTVSASATGIIEEAVRRIPRNYPVRPTQLTGFYRESDDEATRQQYDYLAEGLLQVYKPGYQRPNEAGYVKILESRRVDLRPAAGQPAQALGRIEWLAGGLVPHRFDFVKQRAEFINRRHFKNYQYRFSPQTTFQGQPVYVITFGPRPGTDRANFAGQLYIDARSYAFLGAEWHRTPAGIRRENLLTFEAAERAYRTYYQEFAGRYYLKSIWYNTLGKPWQGQVRHHLAEYLTTAIDTVHVVPPRYAERSQYGDIFLHNPVPYDSAFWQSRTTLLPPKQLRQALLDQVRERRADSLLRASAMAHIAPAANSAAPSPSPSRRRFRVRLSYGYAAGVQAVMAAKAQLRAEVAPAGYTFRAAATGEAGAPAVVGQYSYWYQLELPGHLALRTGWHSLFGEFSGSGWDVGLAWEHNLNPRGRPVLARLGLGYLAQSVARQLGTFDNPDQGLRLAGTRLQNDRLDLALQNRTDALCPSLGLGLELSRRWELIADASCLALLRTRAQLWVVEDTFWWGSDATLNLPASEVQASVNGQPATTLPWRLGHVQAGLGVVYHLR